ncbi:MAG: histidine kinase [Puia sp.]|nr:histidine kinase [Puia sp.]
MKTGDYSNPVLNRAMKYKLYQLPFWLLYNYLWWAVTLGNPVKAAVEIFTTPFFVKFSFYVVFQALAVCFNLYYLIPKFLEKGRFTAYFVCMTLTIGVAALCIVPGYYLSAHFYGKTLQEVYGVNTCFYILFMGAPLSSTVASMTLGMSIKLTKSWMQTKKRQQMLEKEKLETELNFLKYQFNPHFLFNTINSIFFLIHKNPDMASDSLAKFSDLLRYQLYECNDAQIQVSKEITCLENSVELERLRQNDNVEVTLQINRAGTERLGIAPFILMTFVENAFKHVSKHTDKPNWIRIKLNMEGQRLHFSVSNSASYNTFKDVIDYGGIGLKNVRRRLDLIYPEQYELDIQSGNTQFEIRLQLDLTELQIRQNPLQKTA